jgi:hypothetical protein
MKILTCSKCQSQFDVATMQPGSSFVCGKCRNVLQVPAAAPVVQPAPVMKPMAAPPSSAPATVVLSPDEMRRALASARGAEPAPPPAKAQPKLPPAMEARRQQQQQAQTAARAGGASAPAPAPASAPAPAPARAAAPAPQARPVAAAPAAQPAPAAARPSRRTRGGDEGEAPAKKPPVAMIAGIGGGALVLVIGAFVMMKGKGEEPATAPGGGNAASVGGTAGGATPAAAGGTPAAQPEPANLDEWQKFLRMQEVEQRAFAATKRAAATNDAAQLKVLHDWFNDPRLASNKVASDTLRAIVDDGLRADPNADWANLAKGRTNVYEYLKNLRQECAKVFNFKEKDENDIDAALAKAETERWMDAKDFRKIEEIAARVRERAKKLDADPRLVRVEEKKGWIRDNPLFKEFKFLYRWSDPYLICQQYEEFTDPDEAHKNKARIEKANLMANRDAIIFSELNRHYRSLFAERFKLPELREKDRILFAIITWNHPSYVEFYRKSNNGETPSPWIRAFYSPPEQKIFHYLGDDSLRAQDELPAANGRVQKLSDQVTFHEGTHQLEHEYGAVFRGTPLKDGDTNVAPRKSMWWDEGLAEFMGAVEVERSKKETLEGATFFHNRILLERIQQVQGDLRQRTYRDEAKKWTIAELIQPNHNGELINAGNRLLPGNGVFMANLFYARSWGLIHFLYFYDGGKYRSKMLDYMEKVYRQEHGPDALAKVFGRPNAKDWKGIEEEYNWYWDRTVARRIGWRDPESKTKPWDTETDPPTGKFDPNAKEDEE